MSGTREKALKSLEKANKSGKVGRPKGSKLPQTILKEAALKEFNFRVTKMANKLFNSQASIALGTHRMVTVETDEDGTKHVRAVNDEARIDKLIEEGVYGEDYIILVGKPGDWKAANAMLDRAFGKAKESLDLHVNFSLVELAEKRKLLDAEWEEVKRIE